MSRPDAEDWGAALYFALSSYDDELEENFAEIIHRLRDNGFGFAADALIAEREKEQSRVIFMCEHPDWSKEQ